MRRDGIFWGTFLVLVGGLFLLNTLGIVRANAWGLIWPLLLILAGVWILIGISGMAGKAEVQTEQVTVPLDGAETAHVTLVHSVGPVVMAGGTEPGVLISGSFGGGLKYHAEREGATQHLKMKMPDMGFPVFWPWGSWGTGLKWNFRVNQNVPLSLRVKGGAGPIDLDMRDLRLTSLRVDGGIGTSTMTMPAQAGHTTVDLDAGVGTVTIRVPEGVAARIQATPGLGTLSVNQSRFPQMGQNVHQSPGYETAKNRIELRIKGGVGTIAVS